MERATAAQAQGVMGRYLAVDERGRGLRATWRPDHGFTNVSLWQDNLCVETFHLSPQQMGELIAFLGVGLAASVPAPPALRVVEPSREDGSAAGRLQGAVQHARVEVADVLEGLAARVRPER